LPSHLRLYHYACPAAAMPTLLPPCLRLCRHAREGGHPGQGRCILPPREVPAYKGWPELLSIATPPR
ncbi:hypothetical protein, partial [Desulfogranum mediterraneum]|uniref:hypothetical protein n=1 Tax=Desulfogranum mediterraneum TaxID=160661 RepID=UPI001ABF8B90